MASITEATPAELLHARNTTFRLASVLQALTDGTLAHSPTMAPSVVNKVDSLIQAHTDSMLPSGLFGNSAATLGLDFWCEQYFTRSASFETPTYKTFNDVGTFTRATSAGAFNEYGQYVLCPADSPRLDHDPASTVISTSAHNLGLGTLQFIVSNHTFKVGDKFRASAVAGSMWGVVLITTTNTITVNVRKFSGTGTVTSWTCIRPRGLLIEEQRTNLLTYSDMSTGWTIDGGGSLTPNNVLAPDGAITAAKFTFPSSASVGLNYVRRFVTTNTGVTTTCTVFIKSTVPFTLRRPDGVITAAQPATSDWALITLSVTAGTGFNFDIRSESTSAGDIQIWHPQIEAGAFPTSYIPTTTAQVTRAADVATVNTLSPWYNASEGALAARWSLIYPQTGATNQHVAVFSDAGFNNYVGIRKQGDGTIRGQSIVGGSIQANISAGTATSAVMRAAMRIKADDFAVSLDGAAPVADSLGTIPTVNRLDVGWLSGAGQYLNGHIESIRYYPRVIDVQQASA